MLRSIEVAKVGMQAQEAKLDVVANNLANASTHGFKRLVAAYQQLPAGETAITATPDVTLPDGALLQPAQLPRPDGPQLVTRVDLRQGPLEETGNPLDVAVNGEGFLVVATEAGERYTRAGNLRLDAEGNLTDGAGRRVLGGGGPIQLPGGQLQIASDGSISAAGNALDRLRVVRFPDPTLVRAAGDGLLSLPEGMRPTDMGASEVHISQGYLERSNSNPVHELVSLIAAQRIFEAGQRMLVTDDETLNRAVNQLGRVR